MLGGVKQPTHVRAKLGKVGVLGVHRLSHFAKLPTAAMLRAIAQAQQYRSAFQPTGMTSRTAARIFIAEKGLTFGQRRTQLRLMNAVVKLTAADVGYEDVSAFFAVYKRAFGYTRGKHKAVVGRGQYHPLVKPAD